jgi:pantetheine-phosphate adenylyltransferase
MGVTRAIYPGSFDPVTLGHIDIILRARQLFDSLIVAVAQNEAKSPLFDANERVAMIE